MKMQKRPATSDLNHTNWNDEEEPENPGEFKLASAEEMSKRVIKTGKRRLAGASAAPSASPFSKFSFASSGANVSTANPVFSFNNKPSTPSNSFPPTAESNKNESKDDAEDKKRTQYLAKLKGLNEEFLSWLDMHFKKNPTCIFTPIFDDYSKYLKDIQAERDSKTSETSSTLTSASPFSRVKFPLDDKPPASESTSTAAPASIKADDKPAGGSIFGGTLGGGLFGNVASKPGDSPFSFSGTKPFTFGNVSNPLSSERATPAASEGGTGEDETEEPPKNEFKPVTEDDAVFSQRVKVFVKSDGDFAERGVGVLYIKPANLKYQALVRADTSLGNLLLNVILGESMPIKRMGKNNVMLVCIPLPGIDSKPLPTLLRVKTKEDADKLFDELNKYKK